METKVLIADDHDRLRGALRRTIESMAVPCRVVGEAANGCDAVRLAVSELPNIVLMDVAMPIMNGIEATSEISAMGLPTRVIGVSMHQDSCYVEKMLNAGARGYLLKCVAAEGLFDAIRAVLDGRIYLGAGVDSAAARGPAAL